MQELQLTEIIFPLAGGLMMSSALVLLHFMLRRPQLTEGRADARTGAQWTLLLGFILGVPLGAYVVLQVIGTPTIRAPLDVLVGFVVGASLTYVLAGRPMRQ